MNGVLLSGPGPTGAVLVVLTNTCLFVCVWVCLVTGDSGDQGDKGAKGPGIPGHEGDQGPNGRFILNAFCGWLKLGNISVESMLEIS